MTSPNPDARVIRAAWRAMAADPVVFAEKMLTKQPHNVCPAERPNGSCDEAGTEHEHGQVKWLHSAVEPINVLIPGNRFGKSVVSAMRHVDHCMFKKGLLPDGKHSWMEAPYETISIAHAADQASIVFDEAKRLCQHPAIKPFVKRIYVTPFPRIVFFNGSVMHCRSAHDDGKYIDGHAYRYVSIDEAGYFGQDLKKLINGVVLMRLAGGGMLDLIGTPKGFGDLYWYANRGLRGVPGYYTQRGSIFDNPFLSEEDIKIRDRLLEQADPRLREQVLYGAFVSDAGLAFTEDQLEQAFDKDLPAHQPPRENQTYVQAWDLGRKTDYTVGVTFNTSITPWEMVDFVRLNRTPWDVIYDLIIAKAHEYGVYSPVIDATGIGDVVEEELLKRGLFVDGVKISTGAIKTNLINTLQTALDHGRKVSGTRTILDEAGYPREVPDAEAPGSGNWGLIRMPAIPQLVDEFGVYQLDDRKLVQDCVMAVALAVHSVYDGSQVDAPISNGIYG